MFQEYGLLEAPRVPASRRNGRGDAVTGRSSNFSDGKVGKAERLRLLSTLAGEY